MRSSMKKTIIVLILLIVILPVSLLYASPLQPVQLLKSLYSLIQQALFFMFIFFLFTYSKTFKNLFLFQATAGQVILSIILFTLMGIYGSIMGIRVVGAISNIRDTAPLVAGFIGGPIVGIITGFLVALHRFLLGGFTQIPCALATLTAGVVAGFLSKTFKKSLAYWLAIVATICLELFHMVLILLISKPYSQSIALVKEIIIPMVVGNTVGILIFVFILKNIVEKRFS